MATLIPTRPVDDIGQKPPAPPERGGGDSGRGGDQGRSSYRERLRRARVGMICALATVFMIFISLTSAYVVRKGLPTFEGQSNSYMRDWGSVNLPWVLLLINTAILVASSITLELSRRGLARQAALAPVAQIPGVSLGEERAFPWLGITTLLGLAFLAGQWMAWNELHHRGFYVDTNPNSSFVFLLTIAHAVHLSGGVIALMWAASSSLLNRPLESRRIVVDVTAWYWHFMGALWIYIFALLEFAH